LQGLRFSLQRGNHHEYWKKIEAQKPRKSCKPHRKLQGATVETTKEEEGAIISMSESSFLEGK